MEASTKHSQPAARWPKARRTIYGECGPHQIAAALAARGHIVSIDDMYPLAILRKLDWSMPWDPGIIMRRYGVSSRLFLWPSAVYIKNLKKLLERDKPALIIMRSIQGTGCLHWISAWGYDATTDEFLCYDSQCETIEGGHGNARYSSTQLLKSVPWYGFSCVVEVLN